MPRPRSALLTAAHSARARFRRAAAVAAFVACAVSASRAGAQSHYSSPLRWDPAWPRVSIWELGLTGLSGSAALIAYFHLPSAAQPHWTGGIFLDDWLRHGLRLNSADGRLAARTASDITALSTLVQVAGLDSIAVPLVRRSSDVAAELTALNAEGFAVSLLISTLVYKAVGRARPSYANCHQNPSFEPLCNSNPFASFPSGHTTTAFTAAGLSCAHHLHLGLYGSKLADSLACASIVTVAAATGTLRLVGDRHWATDVWAGAALGFAVGYGLPTLLHYDRHRAQTNAESAGTNAAGLDVPIGPMVSGTF